MRVAASLSSPPDGSLPLWPPLLATRGPGAASGLHQHHALHVVVCVSGELRVRADGAAWQVAPGVVTAPDVAHAIDARGTQVLLVFLDPESRAGASLCRVIGGAFKLLTDHERTELVANVEPLNLMQSGGADWTRRVALLLGGADVPARNRMHPRVRKLLALLRGMPPDADTSLESLAHAVGLSPSRLMHAFAESVGVPLRPYLQWLKLQRAASAIASGMPLSEAAHAAGFADAAHMSRTFRRTLGTAPSALRPQRT
jgi:AraC-like DNA-binding protein